MDARSPAGLLGKLIDHMAVCAASERVDLSVATSFVMEVVQTLRHRIATV
jgi:hypothetical protein